MNFKGQITKKTDLPDGRLELEITFTDGVDVVVDKVIPQDMNGLIYMVEQRAESLTTAKLLKNEDNIGKVIEFKPVEDKRTVAEIAQATWFNEYYRLERLESLATKAVLTGANETALTGKIAEARTFLDANIKVEYLDVI